MNKELITEKILAGFDSCSQKYGIEKDKVRLRLMCDKGNLKCYLYNEGKAHPVNGNSEIDLGDLFKLSFLEKKAIVIPYLKNKLFSIGSSHNVEKEHINGFIKCSDKELSFFVFNGNKQVNQITINDFLN